MSDFYFSQSGDLTISPTGDIAQTDGILREDGQQAYIRIMTEPGDFELYPTLGADMALLFGQPQSQTTAELGKRIIKNALEREGRFIGKAITITAAPTGPQTIRFDVYVATPKETLLLMSIEHNLGVE